MIYEMRTYTLRPGQVPEFEKRFGAAIPERTKHSPLGAFWHTEVGPLNQVVHIWPYKDTEERARVRQAAVSPGKWPPDVFDLIVSEESWLLNPAPFTRPMQPATMGNIYEMRMYTFKIGAIPEVIKRWGDAIADREKVSPLAGCFHTETGPLSLWIHIWPYADMNERSRLRAEAMKLPNWPPPTREFALKQENKILIPAEFSPWR